MYQAMIIIAWRERVSSNVLFDEDVLRDVLSIFITAAILNFLRGTCYFFSLRNSDTLFSVYWHFVTRGRSPFYIIFNILIAHTIYL